MIVYKAENEVNRKVYIGKTNQPMNDRWCHHVSSARHGSNRFFHKAIRKYGTGAFTLSVLTRAKSEEELDKMERFWIAVFCSTDPALGYNGTSGGERGNLTDESRKKLEGHYVSIKGKTYEEFFGVEKARELRASRSAALLGKPKSEAHRNNMSKGCMGRPSPRKGATHTHEAKLKNRLAHLGKPAWNKGKSLVEVFGKKRAAEITAKRLASIAARRTG